MSEQLFFTQKAKDGLALHGYSWRTPGEPVHAAVILMHGMTEYALRYNEFASFLSDNGVPVFAFDMRGHGQTSPEFRDRGYFANDGGALLLAEDLLAVKSQVKSVLEKEGLIDIPLFLYGHSMGSLIALKALTIAKGKDLSGVILSGLPECPSATDAGLLIARLQRRLLGQRAEGKFLTNLAFGSYNKRIKTVRTSKDWLSRDESIVDKYVADTDCMFLFKTSGFVGLLELTKHTTSKSLPDGLNTSLPLLLVAGQEDPCGAYGKAPRILAERFQAAGHEVTVKLYPGARHEVHNEINRGDVYQDVLSFVLLATERSKVLRGAMASGPGGDSSAAI